MKLSKKDYKKLTKWLLNGHPGVSSKTIVEAMTGIKTKGSTGVPHDPSDFIRCHKLLKIFPKWRKNLSKVSDKFPEWKPLAENWDEMERVYEKEKGQERMPELYALIKELRLKGDGTDE